MSRKLLIALLACLALVGASCSDDDDSTDGSVAATDEATDEATDSTDDEAVELDEDQQAVADAFTSSFTTEGEAQAATFAPDEALADVLTAAAAALAAQGGATLGVEVTDVAIDGDVATVTFTILLNDAPLAPGQTGHAVMVDGEWRTHLSVLCGLLGLAGPAPEACSGVVAPTGA